MIYMSATTTKLHHEILLVEVQVPANITTPSFQMTFSPGTAVSGKQNA